MIRFILRSGKRIAVSVIGLALVAGGLAMLVLPGPGILVVIAGLAVLGTEYAWARYLLSKTRGYAQRAADKVRRRKPKP